LFLHSQLLLSTGAPLPQPSDLSSQLLLAISEGMPVAEANARLSLD
jgi:hypothetical protein